MTEVRMPRLSESMTEGKLLLWNVAVGDHVSQGEQIAEIEADKANMEIEAPVSGIVCGLSGQPGEMIAVGKVLVEIQENDSETKSQSSSQKPAEVQPSSDGTESALEKRLKQFNSKA